MNNDIILNKINGFGYNSVGPVVYDYTCWILHECEKRNIKKVYFLARDGCVLHKIAKKICKEHKLDIECRYLYCSRFSLRTPTYHFIGEEAFKLIFVRGYHTTPETLLQRVALDEESREQIYAEVGIENKDEELSPTRFKELSTKLRNNNLFRSKVYERSRKAYESTIKYFKQEKVFDDDNFVIVDSGWTGSIQRSFRQLFESQGFTPKITGFYFGLYKKPKVKEDGEYLTYYFNANSNLKHKIMFNNTLLECMLFANTGMTIGYDDSEEKIKPIFKKYDNWMKKIATSQMEGVLRYTEEHISNFYEYSYKAAIKDNYKLLKKIMVYPTQSEIDIFNNFYFCDDVSESYHMLMVDKENKKALKTCMFLPCLFRKIFHFNTETPSRLYWPYGVINCCSKILRPWYRLNVMAWDFVRFVFKSKK